MLFLSLKSKREHIMRKLSVFICIALLVGCGSTQMKETKSENIQPSSNAVGGSVANAEKTIALKQ